MPATLSSAIESWPTPNYTNPVTRGTALYVIAIILSVVSVLIVAARLWARLVIVRKPGLDDGLVVLALGFGIAQAAIITISSEKFGGNRHIWDIRPTQSEGLRFFTWLSEWFFILSTSLTKISILLFYRRLSARGTLSARFKWALRAGIWYNILYTFSFLLVLLLKCRPLDAIWKASTSPGFTTKHFTCLREDVSLTSSGVASVIGDFYATLLPFLLLRKVQLARPLKRALYALFSLGGVVVVSGIMRTVWLYIALKTPDMTWNIWVASICALIETYLSIICSCAPALKPFFIKYISHPVSHLFNSRSRNTYGRRTHSSDYYLNVSLMTRRPGTVKPTMATPSSGALGTMALHECMACGSTCPADMKGEDFYQMHRCIKPWGEGQNTPPPIPPKDDYYDLGGVRRPNGIFIADKREGSVQV